MLFLRLTIIVYLVTATWYGGLTFVGPWFQNVTGIAEIGQLVIVPLLMATGLQCMMWNHLPKKIPQLLLLWILPTAWSLLAVMLDGQSLYSLWEQFGLIHITAGSAVLTYALIKLTVRDVRDNLHNRPSRNLIIWFPVYGIISFLVVSMCIVALGAWVSEHTLITLVGFGIALIHQLAGYVRSVDSMLRTQ